MRPGACLKCFLGSWASGERVYGVLAQNNVEIRSTGGLPGQCCRVEVKDGLVSLSEVRGVRNFMNPGDDEAMCVPLTDEEVALYSRSVGYMSVNTNCIPDFPRVCDIFGQLWFATNGDAMRLFTIQTQCP